MSWETFTNKRKQYSVQRMPPGVVSIYKDGQMNVTSIHDQLGEHVELKYHPDGKIGLCPVAEPTAVSYKVRHSNNAVWIIYFISFVKHYDLQRFTRKRYQATNEGDMFIIDLNNPIGEVLKR